MGVVVSKFLCCCSVLAEKSKIILSPRNQNYRGRYLYFWPQSKQQKQKHPHYQYQDYPDQDGDDGHEHSLNIDPGGGFKPPSIPPKVLLVMDSVTSEQPSRSLQ